MKHRQYRRLSRVVCLVLTTLLMVQTGAAAQSGPTGSLSGLVADQAAAPLWQALL